MSVRSLGVMLGPGVSSLPVAGAHGFRLRAPASNPSAPFPVTVQIGGADQWVWPGEWTAFASPAGVALALSPLSVVVGGDLYQLDVASERDDLIVPLPPAAGGITEVWAFAQSIANPNFTTTPTDFTFLRPGSARALSLYGKQTGSNGGVPTGDYIVSTLDGSMVETLSNNGTHYAISPMAGGNVWALGFETGLAVSGGSLTSGAVICVKPQPPLPKLTVRVLSGTLSAGGQLLLAARWMTW